MNVNPRWKWIINERMNVHENECLQQFLPGMFQRQETIGARAQASYHFAVSGDRVQLQVYVIQLPTGTQQYFQVCSTSVCWHLQGVSGRTVHLSLNSRGVEGGGPQIQFTLEFSSHLWSDRWQACGHQEAKQEWIPFLQLQRVLLDCLVLGS